MSPLYAPVTVTAPLAVPVNVTEQVPNAKVQLVGLNVPAAPVLENATLPVGVDVVPAAVSATVAVQVEPCAMKTGEVHDTVVLVVLRLTVMDDVPLLVAWVVSPP